MSQKSTTALRKASPYTAVITREQFLFFEMRTTAELLNSGLSDKEATNKIVTENLFQYPTEKSLHSMARACIRRLHAMNNDSLITAICTQPSDVSKQICLYAMMKNYRLVWDFMITVIGEKYRSKDTSFGRIDINSFFLHLQEQDDWVASWSESTISKLKQILKKVLVENEYLDNNNADQLNPVLLHSILEQAILENNDAIALPAFNCFL